jgi:hypothetical protein
VWEEMPRFLRRREGHRKRVDPPRAVRDSARYRATQPTQRRAATRRSSSAA